MAKEPTPPPTKIVRNVRLTEVVPPPAKSELLAEGVSPKKPATIVKPKPPPAPPPKK